MDDYPDDAPYQLHLSTLLLEATEGDWRLPLSECPTGRAILRCQRDLQVKILLAALVRRLWQLATGCPESLARLFLLNELCRVLLRKKLPFDAEQLEALIILVSEPTAVTELGRAVLHQLEWQERSTEPVRVAVRHLRRLFLHVDSNSLLRRTKSLLSRPDPVLAEAEDAPDRKRHWRALIAHARRVPKRLSKRWRGNSLIVRPKSAPAAP